MESVTGVLAQTVGVLAQTVEELAEQVALDSAIIGEYYFFISIPLMFLIHVGFLMYEGGAARRKNVMSTAFKNILTLAVITPTFYYGGWWIYGCFQGGGPVGADGPKNFAGFCGATYPWSEFSGGHLNDHITAVFLVAFIVFSWVTASIMSGAVMERIRLSAFLVLAVTLGSVAWVLAASWGWSFGWLTEKYGFHDAAASMVVHGVAGFFALGVLMQLGPRIGKYAKDGAARVIRGHNVHMSVIGLMLIYAGFYGFYMACIAILSTSFPGFFAIYGQPTTLGTFCLTLTFGFSAGFIGGYFASKGDPYWTQAGALAGAVAVSAGADIYHPSMTWLIALSGAIVTVWAGQWMEKKMRVDDVVGAWAGPRLRWLVCGVDAWDFRGRIPDRDQQRANLVRRTAHGRHDHDPACVRPRLRRELGAQAVQRAPGPHRRWSWRASISRSSERTFFPEWGRVPETITLPDGDVVPAEPVLIEDYASANGSAPEREPVGEM